jgi:hypothetical protein
MVPVTLTFVPPGGGEADYGIDVELPAVPRAGDFLCVYLEGRGDRSDFVVLRVWWNLKAKNTKLEGARHDGITVECEYALSSRSSDEHVRAAKANIESDPLKMLPDSGY